MASRSWNRVELIGNLTRDPELRYTPNGAAVCTFSVATNRTYVSEGERKEEVDFHRLVAWNKLAELCQQLLKKGNRAFVSGRLQNRSWEGQDGATRNVTEIVVEDMIVLTPKVSGESAVLPSEGVPLQEPSQKPAVQIDEEEEPTEAVSAKAVKEVKEEDTGKKEEKSKEEVDESDLPF